MGTPRHQCKKAGVTCCKLSLANSLDFDCGSCAQQSFTLPLGQNAALLPYPCIHSASCAHQYCTLLCPLAKMWLCCSTPVLTVRALAQHCCSLLCLSAAVGLRCNTRVSTGGATCFVAQVRLCCDTRVLTARALRSIALLCLLAEVGLCSEAELLDGLHDCRQLHGSCQKLVPRHRRHRHNPRLQGRRRRPHAWQRLRFEFKFEDLPSSQTATCTCCGSVCQTMVWGKSPGTGQ